MSNNGTSCAASYALCLGPFPTQYNFPFQPDNPIVSILAVSITIQLHCLPCLTAGPCSKDYYLSVLSFSQAWFASDNTGDGAPVPCDDFATTHQIYNGLNSLGCAGGQVIDSDWAQQPVDVCGTIVTPDSGNAALPPNAIKDVADLSDIPLLYPCGGDAFTPPSSVCTLLLNPVAL